MNGLSTRTVRLDLDLDLVGVGARSGLLWSQQDFVLAGVGAACRLVVDRPNGSGRAMAELAALAGEDDVDQPGTGPVGFGAFRFDPTRPGDLIVPRITLGRGREGRRWLTLCGSDLGEQAMADAVDEVSGLLERPLGDGRQPSSFELEAGLTPEVWRDEVVAVARNRIRDGEVKKVVLARELLLRTDQPVDQALVVDRLHRAFPTSIVFRVEDFLGASPELLVQRHDDIVRAHPLAGTATRSSDPDRDRRQVADLLRSTKDRWEHQITIDWLLETLLPFCSFVDAEPEPTIVSLANVHHLGTRVEGRLSSPPTSVLDLVAALHPTPAVGGDPQGPALEMIAALERADRDCYAGPTGWVDAAGNGAFVVSVRSVTMKGHESRLFAGAGIVADSDPAAELAETRAKFQAVLSALVQP